jgi:hypothetical protein
MLNSGEQVSDVPHEKLIEPLRRIKKEYVDAARDWYATHAPWSRIAYRVAGVVTILASLSLPGLAAAGGTLQIVALPVVAFVVAAVSALNAFFSLQSTWQKYITTQLLIEGLIAGWEVEIAEALSQEKAENCWAMALKSTRKLVDATRLVVTSEASKFFENLKWPEVKPK